MSTKPIRTRRHKVTTDSQHHLGVAANLLGGDFLAAAPNQSGAAADDPGDHRTGDTAGYQVSVRGRGVISGAY